MKSALRCAALLAVTVFLSAPVAKSDDDKGGSILGQLPTSPQRIVSTVPANGDVNPYGIAFVPEGFREGGPLKAGDILVSNFQQRPKPARYRHHHRADNSNRSILCVLPGAARSGTHHSSGSVAARFRIGWQPANGEYPNLDHCAARL